MNALSVGLPGLEKSSVKQERDTTGGEREGKNFDFDRRLLRNFSLAEGMSALPTAQKMTRAAATAPSDSVAARRRSTIVAMGKLRHFNDTSEPDAFVASPRGENAENHFDDRLA